MKVAGSNPALPTRSRIATLIVGRMAGPTIEAVSLPPKETINKVSKLPIEGNGATSSCDEVKQ